MLDVTKEVQGVALYAEFRKPGAMMQISLLLMVFLLMEKKFLLLYGAELLHLPHQRNNGVTQV